MPPVKCLPVKLAILTVGLGKSEKLCSVSGKEASARVVWDDRTQSCGASRHIDSAIRASATKEVVRNSNRR